MESFTIAVAGDVMLGRLVNRVIQAQGPQYVWGDLLPLLREADLFLVNLECTLTSRTEPWHDGGYKPFHFRAEPSAVDVLKVAGVDFACVANNHIGDFGAQGLIETVRVLDSAGIAHAGAGIDLAAAREAAVLEASGWRVATISATDQARDSAAGETTPGTNYVQICTDKEDFAPVAESIRSARQRADLVIFTIHWGPNMRLRPTPDFRAFARAVIHAGADIFWGHSAHLVQGIEVRDGKPILYDTGDFIDDYAVDPELRNDLSALFLVRVRPPVVEKVMVIPVAIHHMQVNLAQGAESDFFVGRLAQLSSEMGTQTHIAERGRVVLGTLGHAALK
ncbi:MAG TPA: CapA family protein [Dehalococcoidia bacterium]|jgi:poly-gamma-glutamate synthesis protein (capsule biosynthesis protein)|nr:CapA family protein [Dehalococcoidia bacterium]